MAIYQLQRQRRDTQQLARLTSELEHRVHRLATHLDQRIYRLNRVRDLLTGLMHVSVALRQKTRPHSDKLDIAVKRAMTFPELAALIDTINDERLGELHHQLEGILNHAIWPKMWNELDYAMEEADELLVQQSECIKDMHRRVLELLEETTRIEEDA